MSGSNTTLSVADIAMEKEAPHTKREDAKDSIDSNNAPPVADEQEYPSGMKLGMIIIALALSMFLVRH